MNTSETQPKKALKETLFERIECEQVCPRSRLFFQTREYVVWAAWLVSVLIGALAVAVSLFVVTHRQYEIYEATHKNLLTLMIDALPYIWVVAFGLMIFTAIYNLRHTKHGYRYPLWAIVGSSLVLSFAGGSTLQFFGFGYTIDNIVGSHMGMYVSQEKFERRLWQNPKEGRLIGMRVLSESVPTTTLIFEDINGQRWQMNTEELRDRDLKLLSSQKTVRLLGKCTDMESGVFHVCGVFPWMMQKEVTMSEMMAERQVFVGRLGEYEHESHGIMATMSASSSDGVCTKVMTSLRPVMP